MPMEHDREVLIMMTLKRFRALARSYGAELQRWPQEERDGAGELLAGSEEARALLEQERSLDGIIAAAAARQDAARLPRGARDDALTRLRSGVAARIRPEEEPRGWPRSFSVRMRHFGLAATGVFAILAGLLIGGMYGPSTSPAGALSALLQPATLDFLADEL